MRFKGIALSGKMRTGKNTTAEMVQSKNKDCQPFSFADELKRIATDTTELDFFDEDVKKANRSFLIALGQAYREFDALFWVRKTLDRIQREYRLNPSIVPIITDLRFENEAKSLKKKGFMLVRLTADDETIIRRGGEILDDISETELDDWNDWDLVVNTGHLVPSRVCNMILDVFSKSNENSAILEQLREMSTAELSEAIKELVEDGRLTLEDLYVD